MMNWSGLEGNVREDTRAGGGAGGGCGRGRAGCT